MPFVYPNVLSFENEAVVGAAGDCVTLIKTLTPGLKGLSTPLWRKGEQVVGSKGIIPGTAIATFENGKYPRRHSGNHAAYFLAYGGAGFWILDQWKSKKRLTIQRRYIYPARPMADGTYADPSNAAGAFSVIELK